MSAKLIKLVPKGEFAHPTGLVQVVDDAAVKAMASAFDPMKKALVDFDHYSDLTDDQRAAVKAAGVLLPSDAAGWITAVEARPDGLYGAVEWTKPGADALKNGAYRFHSPVWQRRDLESLGDNRVRPLALSKIGLTNEPNIRELSPLANSNISERVMGPSVELAAISNRIENTEMNDMTREELIKDLELPEDATDEQIEAALEARKQKAEEMSNRIKALETENAALKNRAEAAEKELIRGKVEAALKEHEGVIANRADVEAALTKDFDGTLKVLKGLKLQTLPNRADGNIPSGDAHDFGSKVKAQTEAVDSLCNRNPGTSRTQAYGILVAQGHEAFK